jgi:hypothetical protein
MNDKNYRELRILQTLAHNPHRFQKLTVTVALLNLAEIQNHDPLSS